MKLLMINKEDYCIYKVNTDYLHQITEFVVRVNYLHHDANSITEKKIEALIEGIYREELLYSDYSQMYIAEDVKERMTGCIRVMKWNKIHENDFYQKYSMRYKPEKESRSFSGAA